MEGGTQDGAGSARQRSPAQDSRTPIAGFGRGRVPADPACRDPGPCELECPPLRGRRKAVSDLTLEKLILKEAASGNF